MISYHYFLNTVQSEMCANLVTATVSIAILLHISVCSSPVIGNRMRYSLWMHLKSLAPLLVLIFEACD